MTKKKLLVKDLPEEEKNRIIEDFKKLQLSGTPLKMTADEAEKLIAEAKKDSSKVQSADTTAQANTQNNQKTEENLVKNDTAVPNNKSDALQPVKKSSSKPKSIKPEKVSEGKCVICHEPVYSGVCSGCRTKYGS